MRRIFFLIVDMKLYKKAPFIFFWERIYAGRGSIDGVKMQNGFYLNTACARSSC